MYDIKNIFDKNGKIYAGRIIVDNNDGTISKFWLCEDDRQLRKSTEDYRLDMISKINDEYELTYNYIFLSWRVYMQKKIKFSKYELMRVFYS